AKLIRASKCRGAHKRAGGGGETLGYSLNAQRDGQLRPMGRSPAAASVRFVAEGQHARRGLIWRFDRSLTGTLRASTHKTTRRRRSAFPITETELKVMAALAIIGLRSSPKIGYSTPAASGTPSAL